MKQFYTLALLAFFGLSNGINAQYPNFLWARQMGGASDDFGSSVAVDANGNVYATGSFQDTVSFGTDTLISAGGSDIFVSKLDNFGNFLWAKKMGGTGGDDGNSIAFDADGNVYLTGSFQNTVDFGTDTLSSTGDYDIFVSKLDNFGNFLWAKKMGGTGADGGSEIAIDVNGNVFTTGSFQYTVDFDPGIETYNLMSAGSSDIFVSMLNSSGDFVWARRMGGATEDYGSSIAVAANGDVCTTGTFTGTADFGNSSLISAGGVDSYVCRLDASGNFIWTTQISGEVIQIGYSLAVDSIGNIYLTGRFQGSIYIGGSYAGYTPGYFDSFVFKLDTSGNRIWSRQFGGPNGDVLGSSIAVDANGNVYSTGWFYGEADFDPSPANYYLTSTSNTFNITDIFVSKLDASGNFRWVIQMGGTTIDFATAVAVDADGSVYITGGFTNTADFDPNNETNNLTSAGGYDPFVEKLCQIITPTIAPSGDTSFCQGSSIVLTASSATSYLWSNGATTQSITVSTGGQYSVTVSNVAGCTAASPVTIITVTPLPTVDLGADTILLQEGQSVILNPGGGPGASYDWSTGEFTPSIIVMDAGTYIVAVTSAGCTVTDSVVVIGITSSTDPGSKYKITASPNPTQNMLIIRCEGGSTTLVQVFDNLGRLILEDNSFAPDGAVRILLLGKMPSGTYQVKIAGDEFFRIVPVVKN